MISEDPFIGIIVLGIFYAAGSGAFKTWAVRIIGGIVFAIFAAALIYGVSISSAVWKWGGLTGVAVVTLSPWIKCAIERCWEYS